jgi:hypothetical protein
MDADFLVCTDTSKEGLGGVPMQDSQVIAYISRKLRKHEEKYGMHDLELLAIVYALKVWRHYLVGCQFELNMDQCGLQHIFMQSDLNARQRRWLELLRKYEFNITYIKRNNEPSGRCIESETTHIFGVATSDEST